MKNKKEYEILSGKLKALAHPGRLRIVAELMKGECCAGKVQRCVSLSQPHVSQSLKVLRKAGIIEGRRQRTKICYRIADETMARALNAILGGEVK